MKEFSLTGEFWLASEGRNPESSKKFHGLLTSTVDGNVKLHLFSDLANQDSLFARVNPWKTDENDENTYLRIIGITVADTTTGAIEKDIWTLDECRYTGSSRQTGTKGYSKSVTYSPQTAYQGIFMYEGDRAVFSSAEFSLGSIAGWFPEADTYKMSKDLKPLRGFRPPKTSEYKHRIKGFGELEIHTGSEDFWGHDRISGQLFTSFTLHFDSPKTLEEILSIIRSVQDLIAICTDSYYGIEWLNVYHFESPEDAIECYYESVIKKHRVSENDSNFSDLRLRSRFNYNDIGKIDGISKWIHRRLLGERLGWNESTAVAMLLAAEVEEIGYNEHKVWSVVTGTVMLHPSDGVEKSLLRIRQKTEDCLPSHIDSEWMQAVAVLRNRFVAHPEARELEQYPSSVAFYAQKLLYRVAISYIAKYFLDLEPDFIKKQVWENPGTKFFLEKSKTHYIKEYSEKENRLTKQQLEKITYRKQHSHLAGLPPDFDTVPTHPLTLSEKGSNFRIYEFRCQICKTTWQGTWQKGQNRKYRLEKTGEYSETPSKNRQWELISEFETHKELQAEAKVSISSHFCVPTSKQ